MTQLTAPTLTLAPWRWVQAIPSLLMLCFALAGCGGGGGSDGSSAPQISIQIAPQNQTVADGSSAVLAVIATGAGTLSYLWQRDGAPINGASNPVYVTPVMGLADSGAMFAVTVRNADRSVSSAPVTVTVTPVAPSIATAPQARTVQPGEPASFSVIAHGSQPLSYQWQRDGVDIAGATAASYSTANATALDAGSRYRAIVRNVAGAVVSADAVLRVNGAGPVVLGLQQYFLATPGQSLILSTTLAGNPPYTYQWWRNGLAIAGASGTTDDPTVSMVSGALSAADIGVQYAVTVSTAEGSTRSPDAMVSVIGAPLVAAGGAHSLARSANGNAVWAWGSNQYGQLGLGSTSASATPTLVSGLTGVKALAAGADHSLALMNDGTVRAWGRNATGALGDGTQTDRLAPQAVPGLSDVVAVAAGAGRSFAVRADGSLWAWGDNSNGVLGLGHLNNSPVPAAVGQGVSGFGTIVAVAAGARHSLALRADGRVYAAGEIVGTSLAQSTPILVEGLKSIAAIAAGEGFSTAIDVNARLWSWGLNDRGQLGLGDTADRALPAVLSFVGTGGAPLPNFGLAAGRDFALARALDGSVRGWGAGGNGQLAGGEPASGATAPRLVASLPASVISIASGAGHSLAVRSDGSVYAWGANAAGQLGIGSSEARRADPAQVPGLKLD